MKTLSKILIAIAILVAIVPALRASSATALVGQQVTFSVTSDGDAPFTYQWRKGAATIIGATSQTYVIASAILLDAGVYTVTVANSAGSVLSDTATLTVNMPVASPTKATTTITARSQTGTLTTTTKTPGTP